MRERERKRGNQASLFDPRSSIGWEFVEPRVKVHLLDEGYAYIPKKRDFTEDSKEEISGNQGFRTREASYSCYYTSRGRDSSYFDLFSTLRAIWLCFLPYESVWLCKGLFGSNFGTVGNAALF